jgi:peptidoglycan/LPS O-acetylase OafA/YrhL
MLLRWGWTAVDLFFVISGYLITRIILDSLDSPRFLGHFYIRRSLRIWPIYYATLLAAVALGTIALRPFPLNGLLQYLTFTQNVERYWSGPAPAFTPAFAHTWSLAVEEQFYLLWPALILLAGRRGVVRLSLALIVAAVTARTWAGLDLQLLVTRCDGLAMGGLLAATLPERSVAQGHLRRFGCLALGCLAVLALDSIGTRWMTERLRVGFELFVLNLLFTALVALCVLGTGRPWLRPLRDRSLLYLGTISYGLYLFHNVVFALAQKATGWSDLPAWVVVICVTATLGTAASSWKLLEAPCLALKERFPYRDRPSAALALAHARADNQALALRGG